MEELLKIAHTILRSYQIFLNISYVDFSKRTIIMSWRDGRHSHQMFDNFWKVNIMIIAHLVPPFGITWERRRRKKILLKDCHHERQIMSRRDAEDEFYSK